MQVYRNFGEMAAANMGQPNLKADMSVFNISKADAKEAKTAVQTVASMLEQCKALETFLNGLNFPEPESSMESAALHNLRELTEETFPEVYDALSTLKSHMTVIAKNAKAVADGKTMTEERAAWEVQTSDAVRELKRTNPAAFEELYARRNEPLTRIQ